jgi:hypothetical protein
MREVGHPEQAENEGEAARRDEQQTRKRERVQRDEEEGGRVTLGPEASAECLN